MDNIENHHLGAEQLTAGPGPVDPDADTTCQNCGRPKLCRSEDCGAEAGTWPLGGHCGCGAVVPTLAAIQDLLGRLDCAYAYSKPRPGRVTDFINGRIVDKRDGLFLEIKDARYLRGTLASAADLLRRLAGSAD